MRGRRRAATVERRRSSPSAGASSTTTTKLDDYKGKTVKGKIVARPSLHAARRPSSSPTTQARLGDLRYKAFIARSKGAIGLIVVDDGDPTQEEAPLPEARRRPRASARSIPIVVRHAQGRARRSRKGTHTAKLTVALEPVRTQDRRTSSA